jgi:hypothetical protein
VTQPVPYSLYEAARARPLMPEESLGRWQLKHFTISDEGYEQRMRKLYFTSDHPTHEMRRAVPPGDYVSLQRRMTDAEARSIFEDEFGMSPEAMSRQIRGNALERFLPDESRWVPVMSDTPAEIEEHGPALRNARGRVLITGLGLGCLPRALLTLPDVTRIDIIEIDPEVIALTGKYLTDGRVHIWRGSAAEPQRIAGLRQESWCWDYAWHDIWSHISSRNLDDETAEHGISYQRLFDLYEPYADEQDAWAIEDAHVMRRRHEENVAKEREFRRRLRAAPLDEQVEMLYDRVVASRVRVGENTDPFPDGNVPEAYKVALDPQGALKAHIRNLLETGDEGLRKLMEGEPEPDKTPLGNPNAHLEA